MKTPVARAEKDWLEVQFNYLKQLDEIRSELTFNNIPIFLAGDIFDRWNPPPELINFALEHLPDNMWCIPGQHDLPLHNYADIKKSAYWTLVEAGKIKNLEPGKTNHVCRGFSVTGFPWNSIFTPPTFQPEEGRIDLALIHHYCWLNQKTSYPGAPETNNLQAILKCPSLQHYQVLAFGDNHKGFHHIGKPEVLNCGTFIRRKADERDYQPQVGVLMSNGDIKIKLLDTSKDEWSSNIEKETPQSEESPSIASFINELHQLDQNNLDFVETITRIVQGKKIDPLCQKIVLKVLEENK